MRLQQEVQEQESGGLHTTTCVVLDVAGYPGMTGGVSYDAVGLRHSQGGGSIHDPSFDNAPMGSDCGKYEFV